MFPSASKVNRKYARIPNEYDCGCLIVADDASGYFIHACDKHNAAPDMYEALEKISFWPPRKTFRSNEVIIGEMRQIARDAAAKARGS